MEFMNQRLTEEIKALANDARCAKSDEDNMKVVDSIIRIAKSIEKGIPFDDSCGLKEDLCQIWDDFTGTWKGDRSIKDFVSKKGLQIPLNKRRELATFLLKKYASHEPGGRTSCLEMLLNLMEFIPTMLLMVSILALQLPTGLPCRNMPGIIT